MQIFTASRMKLLIILLILFSIMNFSLSSRRNGADEAIATETKTDDDNQEPTHYIHIMYCTS